MPQPLPSEVTEVLQEHIRNGCVNDGRPQSGKERRNAELRQSVLAGPGRDLETVEPLPGWAGLVARIDGTDTEAPSLMLLGHTHVVPANPADWRHDPLGGELIDGEACGRGAVDMLKLTSSMAVRQLAAGRFRPGSDLVFVGVADKEGLAVQVRMADRAQGRRGVRPNTPLRGRRPVLHGGTKANVIPDRAEFQLVESHSSRWVPVTPAFRPSRDGRLRVRGLLPTPGLRGLRHDVPRRRRACDVESLGQPAQLWGDLAP